MDREAAAAKGGSVKPAIKKTCASCAYLDRDNVCRRLPPQRISLEHTAWPVMRPELDWCGEYAPAKKAAAKR